MVIFRVGVILSGNFPSGNCPGGSYPGKELSRWELSRVGIFFGGNFSGWELSGGNHPGGNFPGGSFPSTSATPCCNYSLLCVLLLDVLCSTLWNLVEYKILFPVAIICCILIICYYVSYDSHQVLLINSFIVEYNYGYCKICC